LVNSLLVSYSPTASSGLCASNSQARPPDYVWDLPIHPSNRLVNAVVGGWQVAGTFFYRTGFPFSIVSGRQEGNLSGSNLTANGAFLGTVLYAPVAGSKTSFGTCTDPSNPCFTSASRGFTGGALPTSFDANARNAFRGPGYFNTDLNVKKSFAMTERFRLTLGANFFNVLNHPNFQNPTNSDANSAFGQITAQAVSPTTPYGAFAAAAAGMRILQVFGKITF